MLAGSSPCCSASGAPPLRPPVPPPRAPQKRIVPPPPSRLLLLPLRRLWRRSTILDSGNHYSSGRGGRRRLVLHRLFERQQRQRHSHWFHGRNAGKAFCVALAHSHTDRARAWCLWCFRDDAGKPRSFHSRQTHGHHLPTFCGLACQLQDDYGHKIFKVCSQNVTIACL